MLHKRHLEVYATQEGIQVETCVYFKIVQTLVGIRYNLHFKFCSSIYEISCLALPQAESETSRDVW